MKQKSVLKPGWSDDGLFVDGLLTPFLTPSMGLKKKVIDRWGFQRCSQSLEALSEVKFTQEAEIREIYTQYGLPTISRETFLWDVVSFDSPAGLQCL